MKKLKSNLGVIAFVLIAVAGTSFMFLISTASSQERRKAKEIGDATSITYAPKKREIKSNGSKFLLDLPQSVSSDNLVVGVMPVGEGESETIVAAIVTWKDSKMGSQTFIDTVTDVPDESIDLVNGKPNFSNLTEFTSANSNSLVILLKVKRKTEVSVLQGGKEILAKTSADESKIMSETDISGIKQNALKKVTGVSSLIGELQTRKLFNRFGKNTKGGINQ